MDTNMILIGLLAIFIIVFIFYSYLHGKKKISVREPYEDTFYAKDYAKGNWVSRPTFNADLSPRFDSNRVGGNNIVGDYASMGVQGAALTPVESLLTADTPSYATMGAAYGDPRLPTGGLTTTQVNTILSNKFGRGVTGSPDYVDPKQLLPIPDMKKALARDPSDPNTFMYDRYIFAPLKRRYGNVGVDFIRGDLAIKPIRTGWFDVSPVSNQDVVKGYFSNFTDVEQSTYLRDSIFERKSTGVEDSIPYGSLGERTIYSLL